MGSILQCTIMISIQDILHDLKKGCVLFVLGGICNNICQQYSGENDRDIYSDLQVRRPFKRFHKISNHFKNTESLLHI